MAQRDALWLQCLYTVSSRHSGQCPNFVSLFSGGQGAPWRNGAMAGGDVGPDLAYMQTPHQMITEDLISGADLRAMDGPSTILSDNLATAESAVAACAGENTSNPHRILFPGRFL